MKSLHLQLARWLGALLICTFSVATPAATFYASVSKNKVVKNEVFQLRLVSDQKASAGDIDFSPLEKDFLMSRPSFGSSVNIINGTRSNRSEWTVSLAANRTGIITIPSFTLKGDNTQPIALQVTQDDQAPESKDLVEMQSTLSRSTLYPGESALLKVRLIIKADPRRLQNPNITPPSAEGLELKAASEANQHQAIMDGIEVTIVDQNFRLTAKDAGQYTLTEPSFHGTLIVGSNALGSTRLMTLQTTPKTYAIDVEPKPEDYQGIWLPTSQLTLTQRWLDSDGNAIRGPRYPTKVGDTISREVTIQVAGLTQEQLPNLSLSYPDSLRVYDEKPQFQTLDNGEVTMTVRQVLIPRETGEISLPKVSINWWDTVVKRQKSSQAEGLLLSVAAGEANPALVQPTGVASPPSVETITVNNPGFWPYLTGLFAALWLGTLLIAWRWKASRDKATEKALPSAPPASTAAFAQLQQALARNDGIAICRTLTQWMTEVVLTEAESSEINHALKSLNQSLYSAHPSALNTRELEQLIVQIHTQQAKRQRRVTPVLAKL